MGPELRGAIIAFADMRRCFHVVQTHAFAFRRPEVRSPLAHTLSVKKWISLTECGFHSHIPTDSWRFLRIPRDSYGFLEIPMDSWRFLRIPIDSYDDS